MKKIILIGSGGAGKSTLARQLGEKLGVKVYHLDALFWKPNWVLVSREEQSRVQHQLVQEDEWIIDGNYSGTMEIRLKAADTIIFLDYHRSICLYRAFKRMIQYRKKTRLDMAPGCPERIDFQFLKWIWQFPQQKRPQILQSLARLAKEKEVIILKTPKDAKRFIEQINR